MAQQLKEHYSSEIHVICISAQEVPGYKMLDRGDLISLITIETDPQWLSFEPVAVRDTILK
jgi:hypothetical protein